MSRSVSRRPVVASLALAPVLGVGIAHAPTLGPGTDSRCQDVKVPIALDLPCLRTEIVPCSNLAFTRLPARCGRVSGKPSFDVAAPRRT